MPFVILEYCYISKLAFHVFSAGLKAAMSLRIFAESLLETLLSWQECETYQGELVVLGCVGLCVCAISFCSSDASQANLRYLKPEEIFPLDVLSCWLLRDKASLANPGKNLCVNESSLSLCPIISGGLNDLNPAY